MPKKYYKRIELENTGIGISNITKSELRVLTA